MDRKLTTRIQAAVYDWLRRKYKTEEVMVGMAAEDEVEDDETEPGEAARYLVDFAVRSIGYWQVAEVWLENGHIVNVNDLGEGLPLDDTAWPWSVEEIS